MRREDTLSALISTAETWDVLVIGGGATGLGAALDSASRGYKTVLVEAFDFAKGTSSRSTKLIHGGVRYLRSGQVKMVRESLLERGRLHQNAPHIVHATQFVIPSYRLGSRWYYYAGMKAYDLLSGKLGFQASKLLTSGELQTLAPQIATDGLRGGVSYWDGQFDDARLALALAQTASTEGAMVLNYARVESLLTESGKTKGAVVRDTESDQLFELRAKVVVNATGVFAEQVMRMDDSEDDNAPGIAPSQGTHIVVDSKFLSGDTSILIPETDDGRVLFAIPWHGKVLIGTTDREVQEVTQDPSADASEVEYLLDHAGRYLTHCPGMDDVRSVFAGLRPLVSKSNSKSTASLSREHEIYTSRSGLISVIGGKWTTYRKMGEDVMNLAANVGELPASLSKTANLQLHGARQVQDNVLNPHDPLAVYAPFAKQLQAIISQDSELASPLHPNLPYSRAHVVLAAKEEMARCVEDVLARRTRSLLLDARASVESATAVGQLLGNTLGFSAKHVEADVQSFLRTSQHYLPRT